MLRQADLPAKSTVSLTAGVILNPLFRDWDHAPGTGLTPVYTPEFRTSPATYDLTLSPRKTIGSTLLRNASGAYGFFQRNGMTNAVIVFAADMNDGSSATNKDIDVRITRWYPVHVQELNIQETPDWYYPVVSTYDVTFNATTANTDLNTSTVSVDSTVEFADTIVASVSPGGTQEVVYSPTGDLFGILIFDMHGAAYVSVEIQDGAAPPDTVQVFYGLE